MPEITPVAISHPAGWEGTIQLFKLGEVPTGVALNGIVVSTDDLSQSIVQITDNDNTDNITSVKFVGAEGNVVTITLDAEDDSGGKWQAVYEDTLGASDASPQLAEAVWVRTN